jgi:TPR repeat protein
VGVALSALVVFSAAPASAESSTQPGQTDESGRHSALSERGARSVNPGHSRRLRVKWTPNPPSRKSVAATESEPSESLDLNEIALTTDSPAMRAYVDSHFASAKEGSVESQILMGDLHLNGQLVKRNRHKSLAWYRRAVEARSVVAMAKIGAAHEYTFGAPADPVRAYAWYSVAANHGLERARHLADRLIDSGRLLLHEGEDAAAEIEKSLPWQAAELKGRAGAKEGKPKVAKVDGLAAIGRKAADISER